jgi:glutamine amidotransferase-like uncharacterized protein
MKQIIIAGIGAVLIFTLMAFGVRPITEPLPEIKVALYTGKGIIEKSTSGVKNALQNCSDLRISEVNENDIVGGKLKGCRVVIMPGGTASGEREALGAKGCRALEHFISSGGGFIGICAGAYLVPLSDNRTGADIQLINARLHDVEHWVRGAQTVECLALTKKGAGTVPFSIHFENGPLFVPGNDPYLPEYVSLARYQTDLHAKDAPAGEMTGRDAIIASRFGRGRVILFSPHPEMTPGCEPMLAQAVRWAAGQSEPQTSALGPEFSWEGIFGTMPPQTHTK